MRSADFRARARIALKGHWGNAIPVTLVAAILGGTGGIGYLGTGGAGAGAGSTGADMHAFFETHAPLYLSLLQILIAVGTIIALYSLAVFIIGGAVELGLKRYNIKLLQNEPNAGMGDLFSCFSFLGRALALRLLITLFVLLWSMLLVVPGIIAAFRYSMAPFLMAQDPKMSAMEAIRRSKEMMRGKKADFFVLHLTFIGWAFLCGLTMGIGLLWLAPYMNAAQTAFFLHHTDCLPQDTGTGPKEILS